MPTLKEREARSAMVLSSPLIPVTKPGAAFLLCMRRQRNRSKRAAGMDDDVRYLFVQLTVAELSQFMPTCLYARSGTRCSSTSHPSTTPASSRSLMDRALFVKASRTVIGNFTLQVMNPISSETPHHTPPAAVPHASVYPKKSGNSATSCQTCVG